MNRLFGAVLSCVLAFAAALPATAARRTETGKLIIFHAGSLSVPFQQITEEFNKLYPDVKIAREVAGSRMCARKVTALNKPCDILASADYTVIEDLLINRKPRRYADWVIKFASNEMVIAFARNSWLAERLDTQNWTDLLLQPGVTFGRSDPNSDPCGYRSVLVMKLAEKFYNKPALAAQLLAKDLKYIRPKEVDLLALLEVGQIDCIFIYLSVAKQHNLGYLTLPDQINLKSQKYARFYRTASIRLVGDKPGSFITKTGEPIIYGVTIPRNSPNPGLAEAFLRFLLSPNKGGVILNKNGQTCVVPATTATYERIPASLKAFALPDGTKVRKK